MLVRIVLFLGLSLVLFAGGAVGWQWWQGQPVVLPAQTATAESPAAAAPDAPASAAPLLGLVGAIEPVSAPAQSWLITPGGGLVDRDTVKAWLRQDRLVEERYVDISFSAPLTALLAPGEALPAPVYRQVFADIRASALAADLCAPLVATLASACAVHLARAPEGSLSEDGESAVFGFRLVFTQKAEADPLPDLATRILMRDYVNPLSADPAAEARLTPTAALASALAGVIAACPPDGSHCRLLRLSLQWEGPGRAQSRAEIAWLAPLPPGMYPAPPLAAPPVEE
jgi:hypothetical protein